MDTPVSVKGREGGFRRADMDEQGPVAGDRTGGSDVEPRDSPGHVSVKTERGKDLLTHMYTRTRSHPYTHVRVRTHIHTQRYRDHGEGGVVIGEKIGQVVGDYSSGIPCSATRGCHLPGCSGPSC